MNYKTITLELLQDRPELYETLRNSKRLLTAMEVYAAELKAGHEAWKAAVRRTHPDGDPSQIASAALELAVQDLADRLPSASLRDVAGPYTADDATNFAPSHTPPA